MSDPTTGEPTATAERHASWAELFFDLVAVAGVGMLAHVLSHELDAAAAPGEEELAGRCRMNQLPDQTSCPRTHAGSGLTCPSPPMTTVGTVSSPPVTARTAAAPSGSCQMSTQYALWA